MNNITSNWWRKGYVLSATFLLSLLVITTSCKKDKNLLGGNAIDQNDLLNSGGIDTFSLKTFTIERDSAVTSNPRFVLLGHYNDPEFGPFKSGFYSQVRLSGLNPDFSGSIVIDSFVLALEYASAYGKVSTQNFHVYELDQIMYKDSTYYNFTTLNASQSLMHLDNAVSLEMNPNKITVEAGLSIGLVGRAIKNNSGLNSDTIEKILLTYTDLSSEWFTSELGEMIKPNNQVINSNGSSNSVNSNINGNVNGNFTISHSEFTGMIELQAETIERLKTSQDQLTESMRQVSLLIELLNK